MGVTGKLGWQTDDRGRLVYGEEGVEDETLYDADGDLTPEAAAAIRQHFELKKDVEFFFHSPFKGCEFKNGDRGRVVEWAGIPVEGDPTVHDLVQCLNLRTGRLGLCYAGELWAAGKPLFPMWEMVGYVPGAPEGIEGPVYFGEVDEHHLEVNPQLKGMDGWYYLSDDNGVIAYACNETVAADLQRAIRIARRRDPYESEEE